MIFRIYYYFLSIIIKFVPNRTPHGLVICVCIISLNSTLTSLFVIIICVTSGPEQRDCNWQCVDFLHDGNQRFIMPFKRKSFQCASALIEIEAPRLSSHGLPLWPISHGVLYALCCFFFPEQRSTKFVFKQSPVAPISAALHQPLGNPDLW